MKIIVSNEIESVCPGFVGAAVEAKVVNSEYCAELWNEIHALEDKFRVELTTESLKELSGIAATRRVYKACGKDPSRYRPASEQLIRRLLQGKELYQIDTLVDLVNLASIAYGYSIGGFDADQFVGDTLTLGIGRKDEPYEGIGRGMLNIGYDGDEEHVLANARFIQELVRKYCQSDGGTVTLYRAGKTMES